MIGTSGLAGQPPAEVVSPCINVCKIEAGLCIGCLRTLDEIACWADADDDDKRLILAAVARRRIGPAAAQP